MLYFFFSDAKLTGTRLVQEEWVASKKAMSVQVRVLQGADVYEGKAVLRRVAAEPANGSEGEASGTRKARAVRVSDCDPVVNAKVLQVMLDQPPMLIRSVSDRAGWLGVRGKPSWDRVHRALMQLVKEGLVCMRDGGWMLTAQGRQLAERSAAHETSETACAR